MALFERSHSKSKHIEIAVSEIRKVDLLELGFKHTIPDSKKFDNSLAPRYCVSSKDLKELLKKSNYSVTSSHFVSRIIKVEKMQNYNFQVQISIVGYLGSHSCHRSKYRFRWQLTFNFEK